MVDFSNHTDVLEALGDAQEVEMDNRERSREAHLFLDARDGQWEQNVINNMTDRPRYTFDMTGPIVNQVAGEIQQADFGIRVKPAGGDVTKDDALLLDGLVRNIENVSDASNIFNAAARSMVTGGIAGWEVEQRFVDADSFDQDLMIVPILDFTNRVWFDPGAKEQNKSDAGHAFKISAMSKDDYKEAFPEGSGQSVSNSQQNEQFGFKADDIFVGRIYFKKQVERELLLMTDGQVLENSEEFQSIQDDLAAQGVTVKDRRNRPRTVIMSRLFDASDWLISEEETVFSWLPIIPTYGNYKIDCNKTLYRGVVEKLMDPQRVLNYAQSRSIEEGALAPRAKVWLTPVQAEGHEATLGTLNTNHDAFQIYNPDPAVQNPPGQTGGATINPGLQTLSNDMKSTIGQSAGMFAANMGDNPGLQSGVAIQALQNKGDTGTIDYFQSQEIAICHTARVIIDAIPRVYDTERQIRILKEDGSFDMATLNEEVRDEDSGELVTLNDLSKGKYDVTCSAGPSFQNRQQEAVQGILDVAKVDPSVMQIADDILTQNMTSPGMEQVSERLRAQKFDAGLIPVSQMTDDEKQQMIEAMAARQQEGAQPDPNQVAAQALLIEAQNEEAKTQVDIFEKREKLVLAANRERREDAKFQQSVQSDQAKFTQSVNENQFSQFMAVQQQQTEDQKVVMETVKTMAEALKIIQEAAQGPIVGPGFPQNVKEQSDLVSIAQDTAERV